MRHGFLRHMPDIDLSDQKAIREQVWDFDPQWEFEYSQRELLLMAEKILLNDPKPRIEHPYWLTISQLKERERREIHASNGTPDPAFASGLYWRTHPEGRRFWTDEQRRSRGAGFYR